METNEALDTAQNPAIGHTPPTEDEKKGAALNKLFPKGDASEEPTPKVDENEAHHETWLQKREDFFKHLESSCEEHAQKAADAGHQAIAHSFNNIKDVASSAKKKIESVHYWKHKNPVAAEAKAKTAPTTPEPINVVPTEPAEATPGEK